MWRERRPAVTLAKFSVRCLLVCRTLPLYLSQGTTGKTYRNACTACASCCDAFRSWKYPWLYGCQSRCSVAVVPSGQVRGVLILNGDYRNNCQYVGAIFTGRSGSIPGCWGVSWKEVVVTAAKLRGKDARLAKLVVWATLIPKQC